TAGSAGPSPGPPTAAGSEWRGASAGAAGVLETAASDAGAGMDLTPRSAGPAAPPRSDRLALAILLAAMLLLWLPAAWTPFWGDDYYYLSGARLTNDACLPWIATFWPQQPQHCWRPLSQ